MSSPTSAPAIPSPPDATQPPPRSWLYVPGNRPRMLENALGHGADAAVFDLEDSVPVSEKDRARTLVAGLLETLPAGRSVVRPRQTTVWVRTNRVGTDELAADLKAVVRKGLDGLRIPKVESADQVATLDKALRHVERAMGLRAGQTRLVCGIESALGVIRASAIASASPRVVALGFGGADFQVDVGATEGANRLETLVARSTLVLASRAVDINPPVDTVYLAIDDDEGLRESTTLGRDLGFFGRSAIHPRQVPIINAVFTPSAAEVASASRLVAAAEHSMKGGMGSLRLADGTFVDFAVLRRAQMVLQLAARLETSEIRGQADG